MSIKGTDTDCRVCEGREGGQRSLKVGETDATREAWWPAVLSRGAAVNTVVESVGGHC